MDDFLHFLIMLIGLSYLRLTTVPYFFHKLETWMNPKIKIILFWSSCFVFCVVNITFSIIEMIFFHTYDISVISFCCLYSISCYCVYRIIVCSTLLLKRS